MDASLNTGGSHILEITTLLLLAKIPFLKRKKRLRSLQKMVFTTIN
jgi:hypothetical protein